LPAHEHGKHQEHSASRTKMRMLAITTIAKEFPSLFLRFIDLSRVTLQEDTPPLRGEHLLDHVA
jgi:hypothetical protein